MNTPLDIDHITEARYIRAKTLHQHALIKLGVNPDRHQQVAFNTSLHPHWIGESGCFWYERESAQAKQYRLVDTLAASNKQAFDHTALANGLAELSHKTVDADKLPLTQVSISLSPLTVGFTAFGQRWIFDGQHCQPQTLASKPARETLSPDGRHSVFLRDNNLWLRETDNGAERALTTDGEERYVYGAVPVLVSPGPDTSDLQVVWSPDSQRVLTVQLDTRQVETLPVIHHVPSDGSVRPQVEQYPYPMPGDTHVPQYHLLSIELKTGKNCRANYRPVGVPIRAYFTIDRQGWWASDSQEAYFVDLERGSQAVRVVAFNTDTGATRILFEETSSTWINLGPLNYLGASVLMPLPETKELVWYSERSGWAHLYLYDLETGAVKHAITESEWVVRELLHYDLQRRELWLQTGGRTPGRDPYYLDIVRVNIDTGELTTVASSDHDYYVVSAINSYLLSERLSGISPDAEYLVTTRGRVDGAPVSVLLDRQGNTVLELEVADVSGLPDGWQWPEPVQLTAADGETDIYGVIFRPSDYSPDKSYPVIDNMFSYPIYTTTCKRFDEVAQFMCAAALAELGFIVVHIDGRGTPLRSKAFLDVSDGWMASAAALPDHIAGLQQLAKRYPSMDLDRVGIFGGWTTSHGPLFGLLEYPEFYKVGVTRAIPDSRLQAASAVEQFEGPLHASPQHQQPESIAENLQGKLLMVHGMLDMLCQPTATFRMVEALQQANKDFDLVLDPNQAHGCGHNSYMTRRIWDYFVKHLQGLEPPKAFNLQPLDSQTQE